MTDKWHEMLDHLVNKNEDQAKEAFKSIIDNEKESFVAQDAIEPEVVEKTKVLKLKKIQKTQKTRNNLSYFLSKKSLNDCLPPSYRQVPSVL